MRKTMIALALSFSFTTGATASKLNIDYYKPSPTKALAYSLIIPGGGYLYLSENTSAVRYKYAGLIFCALGIASYAHLAKQTKDGDPVKVFFAITLVAGLRIFEWGEVIEDAEKERFAAYRAEQKKMAVALKAAEPAGE